MQTHYHFTKISLCSMHIPYQKTHPPWHDMRIWLTPLAIIGCHTSTIQIFQKNNQRWWLLLVSRRGLSYSFPNYTSNCEPGPFVWGLSTMNKATNTHCWNQSRHINALPPTHFLLVIVIALIYLAIFMTWLPFLWCYHNEAVFESFLIYFPSKKIEKCCCRGIFHDCVISYCLKWWTNGQRRRKKKVFFYHTCCFQPILSVLLKGMDS